MSQHSIDPQSWIQISPIRNKKSPFSQLRKIKASVTLLQQVTEDFKEGKTKQRAKDQETKR
jgi:hypothetical protein